jgi:hypothetical protein
LRADEPLGVPGHDDSNRVSPTLKKAEHIERLVGGDATAYCEKDLSHTATCLS